MFDVSTDASAIMRNPSVRSPHRFRFGC